ncbi:MAG: anaerobic ribonucleoside-triphosphate reductase activating protein [Sedimentisphaerales bacterium]|nr:anaerobic ribonucleoside-triphosphate reductase activating protein [Sedimentisphaerales bacterium]
MNIGGFQSLTLSDYPGLCAAIAFTRGCNFCCGYCHNQQLIARSSEPDNTGQVLDLLKEKTNRIDGLVISGGEPTIHHDLPDFIDRVRQPGLKVKLDTNGSNPDMLARLLADNMLDFVAMDIKATPEKYSKVIGIDFPYDIIAQSIDIIARSGISALFRTTFIPDILTTADIERIADIVPENCKYVVQPYKPHN